MTLAQKLSWILAGIAFLLAARPVLDRLAVLLGDRQQRSLIKFRRSLRPEHDEPGAVDRETLVLLAASGGVRRLS